MAKKSFWFVKLILVLVFEMIVVGCASIQPMSNEAIRKYVLASNPGNFRNFQYYVSRDIVLTYVSSVAQSTAVGRISINRDVIQLLSSTPGIIIDVKQNENGNTMLGVAFETSDNDLLWFIQNPDKAETYFYLAYTDEATGQINYGGNPYIVSYEKATGIRAFIKRLNPFSKVKKGKYDDMEPILLYEERVKESEQRRNLQGRKL
jgi:hypothetical protein